MVFGWMWRSRRQSLLEWGLEPPDREALASRLWQYDRLSTAQQRALDGWVRVFMTERNWEPCGGLDLTREMQLAIAGQAGLLVLGWSGFFFDAVPSILVYPDAYVAPKQRRPISGEFYIEEDSMRHGESWSRGPIILSWTEAEAGGKGWNEGSNLVLHEFTHHLDTIDDRTADGMPALAPCDAARWRSVFQRAEERLAHAARTHGYSVLDPYGLEDRSELFAVSIEAFFQHADWLYEEERELYELLRDYLKLDPRPWGVAPGRPE